MVTATTTLGNRGLVRIPTAIRRDAGMEEGQELVIVAEGSGRILLTTREAIRDEVWAAAPQQGSEVDTVAHVRAYRAADRARSAAKFATPAPAEVLDAGPDEVGAELLKTLGL